MIVVELGHRSLSKRQPRVVATAFTMIAAEHVQVISLELASLPYLPGDAESVALLNVLVEELLRDFPQVSVVVRYADNLHSSVYPMRG